MRKFEIVSDNYRKFKDEEILIPKRSTEHSAGYDFTCPIDVVIYPNCQEVIPTDIKAKMWDDEVLQIYPRSSFGIKKNLMLSNTVGVIDSDYYSNKDNDGNIHIAYYNYGKKPVEIKKGEKIAQGVFIKFLKVRDDASSEKRVGGIGSTVIV